MVKRAKWRTMKDSGRFHDFVLDCQDIFSYTHVLSVLRQDTLSTFTAIYFYSYEGSTELSANSCTQLPAAVIGARQYPLCAVRL